MGSEEAESRSQKSGARMIRLKPAFGFSFLLNSEFWIPLFSSGTDGIQMFVEDCQLFDDVGGAALDGMFRRIKLPQ
jgi:hypothetical protein